MVVEFFNRARDDNTSLPATSWPMKDIVYVSVVGLVMLAALLEWVLWLMAFLYCLANAYRKADDEAKWSTRILAVLNMIVFVAMRAIFLPIMIVTLPLPPQLVQSFPQSFVSVLQWYTMVAAEKTMIDSLQVCLLHIRRTTYHSMAALRVPACHS